MDSKRSTTKPKLSLGTTYGATLVREAEERARRRLQELSQRFDELETHLEDDAPFGFEVLNDIYVVAYDLARDATAIDQWLAQRNVQCMATPAISLTP